MAFILIAVGFGKPLHFASASPLYQHCVSVRTSSKSLLLHPHTPKRNPPAYHDDKKALFFIYKNKTLTGDTNNSQMRLLYLNSSYGLSLHSEKSYYLLFHKPELKSLNKGSSSILLLFLIYLKSFKNM